MAISAISFEQDLKAQAGHIQAVQISTLQNMQTFLWQVLLIKYHLTLSRKENWTVWLTILEEKMELIS